MELKVRVEVQRPALSSVQGSNLTAHEFQAMQTNLVGWDAARANKEGWLDLSRLLGTGSNLIRVFLVRGANLISPSTARILISSCKASLDTLRLKTKNILLQTIHLVLVWRCSVWRKCSVTVIKCRRTSQTLLLSF